MTTRRVNVRGIVFKSDGTILAQQLTPGLDGVLRDSWWCTPGGGLDIGESLEQGLSREMIEETGIAPKIGKLLFIQQFNDGKQEQLEFFFLIENAGDYENINLDNTSHGKIEIEKVEFINPKTENILPTFLQTINIPDYVNSNLPVHIYNEL